MYQKMNKVFKYATLAAGLLMAAAACDKWTETQVLHPADLTSIQKSEEYYAALRAYKETDHEVAFGWFGNWGGTGISMENSLMGLPDSVDFVSLWGNWQNPGEDRLNDLKKVKELKGTKALVCFLVFDIGDQITPNMPEGYPGSDAEGFNWKHEFWGWGETMEEHIAATEKYARAILDTIAKYDYDGFDLDAEPSYAQPFATNKELWRGGKEIMEAFVKTLATELGPKSGTGKLLVIDGEPEAMGREFADYFDYFILQAYGAYSEANLQSRYNAQVNHWCSSTASETEDGEEASAPSLTPEQVANKLIVCENFEAYAANGGVDFSRPDGSRVPSLHGMAMWEPTYEGKTYRKGGVGTYHMEYEYGASGSVTLSNNTAYKAFESYSCSYPWLRKAIQIMNPRIY